VKLVPPEVMQILRLKCAKFDFRSPRPLAVFKGPTSKGGVRKGRGRKEKGGGRKQEGKESRGP